MLVSDIKLVTDGEEVNLPSQVEVPDSMSDDEFADYLSDPYRLFMEGFPLPMD